MSDSLLVSGVATLLAAANVGTWSATGAYNADQVGIYVRKAPSAADNAIALSTYPVADDPSLSDSVTGLQVITRTAGEDPWTTDDLHDAVFDQLHGLENADLVGGVRLVQCMRRSGVSLGQDELKRWSRSDNYYVTIWRPSLNRT